jgi:hypothetical protein
MDPTVKPGRALKAWFKSQDGYLKGEASSIVAIIDPKNPGTKKGTARIAGQRLDSIASVVLNVDFSFFESVGETRKYSAQATYTRVDQTILTQDFDCLLGASGPISLPQ